MATGESLRAAVIAAVLLNSGCSLYQPRPVTFHVRDGDTGEPIADAKVQAQYWAMLDFGVWSASVGPRDGATDPNGNLTLVIDPQKYCFRLHVTADGYPEDLAFGRATFGNSPLWARLVPGAWWSLHDEYDVRLFRGKPPTADVTVPDGYRGVVLVRFAQGEPRLMDGRREFMCAASSLGAAEIADGEFFESIGSYHGIRARYPNATAVPTYVPDRHNGPPPGAPADEAVALRFITPVWEQHIWLYVLGTAAEAEAVERTVWPDHNHFDDAAFQRIVDSHPFSVGSPPHPHSSELSRR